MGTGKMFRTDMSSGIKLLASKTNVYNIKRPSKYSASFWLTFLRFHLAPVKRDRRQDDEDKDEVQPPEHGVTGKRRRTVVERLREFFNSRTSDGEKTFPVSEHLGSRIDSWGPGENKS